MRGSSLHAYRAAPSQWRGAGRLTSTPLSRQCRIAAAQGADGDTIVILSQALGAEDRLAYDEPPTGSYPSDMS